VIIQRNKDRFVYELDKLMVEISAQADSMKGPIPIALDVSALASRVRSGVQLYTEGIFAELSRRPDEVSVRAFHVTKPFKRSELHSAVVSGSTAYLHPSLARVGEAVITHSTDNKFLYKPRKINIATVHDVAIFLPENDIPGFTSAAFREKQHRVLERMCDKADHIIAVSETTKRDLSSLLSVEPSRVSVVYQGIEPPAVETEQDKDAIAESGLRPQGYLLFVGVISIRKNLLGLIRAFERSQARRGLKLVLVGPMSMGSEQIRACGEQLGSSVVLTDSVSQTRLAALYRNAAAFVFPTYYEGFGRPILEAMSYGLPVLIGNRGAAPEIAGGTAVEADPFSIESMAEGIDAALNADFDADAARSRAAEFTWRRCGDQLVQLYRKLTD